mmetsp:Transcript_44427/g.114966  ORF Transcript_44427/g.114966 Transcript_44427/m.114966 type:complete len:188 (-) Transcript_44427:117-680(-)
MASPSERSAAGSAPHRPLAGGPEGSTSQSSRAESLKELRNKIEAVAWVLAAAGVAVYGDGEADMLHIVLHHASVKRDWLFFGLAMVGVNVAIFLYLAVWLNVVRGVAGEWEEAAPMAIPIGTCAGLIACFAFMVALWPIWSFLTPILLFVLFMGFIMSAHFWPSFGSRPACAKQRPPPEVDREAKTL